MSDTHTDQQLQQALLQPLTVKGSSQPPQREGLYCFIQDNRRYPIHIRATLAGNLIGSGTVNPWVNRNVRELPAGHWFGHFYSMEDCQTFIGKFKIQ